jgi:Carboxypeptidase regulatory-like domain
MRFLHYRPGFGSASALSAWLLLLVVAGLVDPEPADARQAPADDAALSGVVLSPDGAPLPGAALRLRHLLQGTVWVEPAGEGGRFRFEHVPVGGPYQLEAAAIGYQPVSSPRFTLELGRELRLEVRLGARATTLSEVRVVGERAETAGPAYSVPGEAIRSLPLFNRGFAGLLQLVPHAVGRSTLSFGGQDSRYNAIRIDGTIANDVFGLGLTPGSSAGAPAISIEALSGVQILVAPFDVRHGGFSGGAIDVVTRSGTNRLEVSAVSAVQRGDLVGRGPDGEARPALNLLQYGFTAGGPLRRDRLHFFLAVDVQRRDTTYQGPTAGDPVSGVSPETARRIQAAMIDRFGIDPGGPEAPETHQPNSTLFGKLSWQPSARHRVELGYQRTFARADGFDRSNGSRGNGWMLSGSGYVLDATINAVRLRARSDLGALRNELTAGFQASHEDRDSRLETPLFLVQADVPNKYVAAGSFRNAQATLLDQRQLEVADNLTVGLGRHELTAGGGLEAFHFVDNLLLLRWGAWTFANVDSLERGVPTLYEIGLPATPGGPGPVADFGARTVAGYLQDRWMLSPRLTISAGFRAEALFVDGPAANPALAASSPLGRIDTGAFPSGTLRLSPRIAATLALDSRERTMLRLGFGDFVTRPPFVLLSNAYTSTGQDQRLLTCTVRTGVPAPTADLLALPTSCPGVSNYAGAAIVAMAPDLRFPSDRKLVVGIDRALVGWTVSADLAAGWSRSSLTVVDRNLAAAGTDSEGRTMYGAIGPSGAALPVRRDPAFGPVFEYRNTSGDHSLAVTVVFSRRWSGQRYLQIGYQWSRAIERLALNANNAPKIFQNALLDGTMDDRSLTRSTFDVPHNLTAVLSTPVGAGLRASFVFRAQSGSPFAYAVSGDANADSVANNDLFYVPRDSADISLTNPGSYRALDRYISGEACLQRQRGRMMQRNSCRNPGFLTLDVRLARPITIRGLGTVELTADLFNLPNLIHGSWGLFRQTSDREGLLFVRLAGWDAAANRPRYEVPAELPIKGGLVSDLSRWRLQLGGRYQL